MSLLLVVFVVAFFAIVVFVIIVFAVVVFVVVLVVFDLLFLCKWLLFMLKIQCLGLSANYVQKLDLFDASKSGAQNWLLALLLCKKNKQISFKAFPDHYVHQIENLKANDMFLKVSQIRDI